MLVLVRSSSYAPDASVNEFVLVIMLVLVRSFSYITHSDHSEDVLKTLCMLDRHECSLTLRCTPRARVS